jgi:microcystin-dependent protein
MAPYVGEIRMFAGNFAPNGWMFCEGQTLPISENDVLFTLIGTTYGGDGQETFNLPNLASRIPLHMGQGPDGTTYQLGEMAGVESVTLTTQQIPTHTHAMVCSSGGGQNSSNPANGVAAPSDLSQFNDLTVAPNNSTNAQLGTPPFNSDIAGGSQPHENTQPFLCINFIISLFGVFPSQT